MGACMSVYSLVTKHELAAKPELIQKRERLDVTLTNTKAAGNISHSSVNLNFAKLILL